MYVLSLLYFSAVAAADSQRLCYLFGKTRAAECGRHWISSDILKSDCFCVALQGCASWKWYFPFHYAPFASDFKDIKEMFTEFEKGTKPVRNFFFPVFCFSLFFCLIFCQWSFAVSGVTKLNDVLVNVAPIKCQLTQFA